MSIRVFTRSFVLSMSFVSLSSLFIIMSLSYSVSLMSSRPYFIMTSFSSVSDLTMTTGLSQFAQ